MEFLKYLIIGGAAFFIIFIFIILIIVSKKKVNKSLLKINYALDNIDEALENKEKLIVQTKDVIKSSNYLDNFKDEDFMCDDEFEYNELLDSFYQKFNAELLDDEELINDEKVKKLSDDIMENEIKLKGAINYYNWAVENYLDLKKTFPIRLIKLFCGFKKFKLFELKRTNINNY